MEDPRRTPIRLPAAPSEAASVQGSWLVPAPTRPRNIRGICIVPPFGPVYYTGSEQDSQWIMVISNINWIVYSPIFLYIFINQQGGFKLLTLLKWSQVSELKNCCMNLPTGKATWVCLKSGFYILSCKNPRTGFEPNQNLDVQTLNSKPSGSEFQPCSFLRTAGFFHWDTDTEMYGLPRPETSCRVGIHPPKRWFIAIHSPKKNQKDPFEFFKNLQNMKFIGKTPWNPGT